MEKELKLNCDYITFTFLFKDLKCSTHKSKCEKLSNSIIKAFKFDSLYKIIQSKPHKGYNNCKSITKNGTTLGNIQFHDNMPIMGITLELFGSGIYDYLSAQNTNLYELPILLTNLTNRINIQGDWKITRYDVALDIINYGINLTRINNKLAKGELKFQQLSKRSNSNNYIDRVKQNVKIIGSGNSIETIYVGNRSIKGAFLRFYNKKKELEKKKSFSNNSTIEDWFRYEVELKFEKEPGIDLFMKLSSVKDNEQLSKFNSSLIINHFRLVTKNNNDASFISDLYKLNKISKIGNVIPKKRDEFSLEKSKEHFLSGKSGLQSLLYKIKNLIGEEAMEDYINEILDYQKNIYEPTKNDLIYIEKFN